MNNLPHTQDLLKSAIEESFTDPAYFLRFFLTEWFPSAIPPFHMGLIALRTKKVAFLDKYPECHDFLLKYFHYEPDMRDPDAKPTPVFSKGEDGRIYMTAPEDNINEIIPRGFSKTTLTKGLDLYDLLVSTGTFIVYISESASHSEAQLLDVKAQLEENNLLRTAYGNQVPTRADVQTWGGSELQLLNGNVLVAKGRGGQVRGLTRNGRRPNLIILDDIEDEDSVATDIQRNKTSNWFYGSVKPAGQLMEGAVGEEWAQDPLRIISLGTLLGPECLVVDLSRDETFSTIRFGAKLDDTTMLWSYKMSRATYELKRGQYQRQGKLSHFAKEYDSVIRVDEEAIFPAIFPYQPVARGELVQVAIMLDPAISDRETADEAAIVVAGRHSSGVLWMLDEWGGVGKTPKEKIDAFFDMAIRWNVTHAGIEAIAYQAALLHLAREEMARRKRFFHIEAVHHGSKTKKEDRIVGTLSPRYSNHYIRHYRPLQKLEGNLTDWPNGRKDFADAAAMALNLLGESAGLVMEGALDDLPALETNPLSPAVRMVGGYMAPIGGRTFNPAMNRRYGGR